MVRFGRAAGIFAVGISLALGATFAAPSQAEEAVSASTISYTEHASAALNAAVPEEFTSATAEIGKPASELTPVATHAVATIEPVESQEAEKPEPRSLNELVAEHASSEVSDAELECLATAVYFESKSEPLAGQLAVADVIINRTQSGRFPKTICGVVKQRGQFSFVRGGHLPSVNRGTAHWRTAVAISKIARQELSNSKTENALFFHARRVSPGWRLTRVGIVGNHVFYR